MCVVVRACVFLTSLHCSNENQLPNKMDLLYEISKFYHNITHKIWSCKQKCKVDVTACFVIFTSYSFKIMTVQSNANT